MKLHEYQAKTLISEYGVAVPKGGVAATPQEAEEVAKGLDGHCVVKAQVHAGGRGKAGGVRLVATPEEAGQAAGSLLGTRLVTMQTGPGGAPVHRVLVEETLDVERELYLGIVIDGAARAPVVIASSAGGMEIEDVSREYPELILREVVDTVAGFRAFQGRRLAAGIGLPFTAANAFAQQASRLYQVFLAKDCSMVEINPLILTKDGRVIALDAKVTVDDDALFRQPNLAELRDWSQEDELEAKAGQSRISYVKLDGDVGCLVNGAGLAMATMDIVSAAGFNPANFLDVGGGADPDRVAETIGILLADPKVKRILVNVFGGIARCDDIALGIVKAIPASHKSIPIVVRFLGTNMEEGKRILQESDLRTHFVDSLTEAIEVLKGSAKA
jgi:succinyl-CoA synthetase beta subunit